MEAHEILVRPVMTERATALSERLNQVVMQVGMRATKTQIRRAIEKLYGVTVLKVRTSVVPGKLKRRGKSIGRRPNWKKALITLKPGDEIDFFGTAE